MIKKRQILFYLFPALTVTVLFFIVPIIYIIVVSFYKWNGLGEMEWIGIKNYINVVGNDQIFRTAVMNTILWIGTACFIHIPLAIVLALLLNRKPYGWKQLRVLYFIPNVISTTAIAFLWYFIFHVDVGLLNNILSKLGLGKYCITWLGTLETAKYCVQVPFALYVGLSMIIFFTQLTTISPELYEAAEVDGATKFQKDIYISLPLLKPAIITNLLLNIAFCLKNFEYPSLMTAGGPANSTMNLSLYIYWKMVSVNKYGESMVASLVTVMLGLVVMIVIKQFDKGEKRQNEK